MQARDDRSKVHVNRRGVYVKDGEDAIRIGGGRRRKHRQPGGPYRSRHGIIMGVCAGLAQHLEMSVFWMRVIWFLVFLFTGFWPIVFIYIIAAVFMKPEPVLAFASDADAEFYNSAAHNRGMAIRRLKRTYDNLERRIQRMESVVTSREFDWQERMNQA